MHLTLPRSALLLCCVAGATAACDPGRFDRASSARDDAGGGGVAQNHFNEAGRGGSAGRAGAGGGGADAADGGSGGEGGRDAAGTPAPGASGGAGAAGSEVEGGGAGGAGAGGASGAAGAGAGAGEAGAAAGMGGGRPDGCPVTTQPGRIARQKDLGVLAPSTLTNPGTGTPLGRTGGPILRVGERVLWLFQISEVLQPVIGWASPEELLAKPPRVHEAPMLTGAFPPEDLPQALYQAHSALLTQDSPEVMFYFTRVDVPAGMPDAATVFGTGTALLARDQYSATIVTKPGELFGAGGYVPKNIHGAFDQDGFVYSYDCQTNPNAADEQTGAAHEAPCHALRVPRAKVHDGASYEAWDGTQWQSDYGRAVAVIDHVSGELSVAYNSYLGKYLAVHPGRDAILVETAATPVGPFETLPTGVLLQNNLVYLALEHASLRANCERTLYLSYVQFGSQDNHLLEVELE